MEANELMIGDLVQYRDEFNEVTGPYEIDLISNDEIAFKGEVFARVFNNSIEPIPLTPEILEKNFPTAGELAWWPVEDGLHCESRNTEDIMVSGVFRFVHQLQNALRLVDIDKSIEL